MYLSKNLIDLENGNYTFSDYFKMNISSKNLAKTFGYTFMRDRIEFNTEKLNSDLEEWTKNFHKKLFKIQKKINLNFKGQVMKMNFLLKFFPNLSNSRSSNI